MAGEGFERTAVEAKRFAEAIRKQVGQGFPLADVRSTLWLTFHAEIMEELSLVEPRLQRDSPAYDLGQVVGKIARRLPRGMGLADKVGWKIEASGSAGVSVTSIQASIRPIATLKDIRSICEGYVHRGYVIGIEASGEGKRGRPCVRYRLASV